MPLEPFKRRLEAGELGDDAVERVPFAGEGEALDVKPGAAGLGRPGALSLEAVVPGLEEGGEDEVSQRPGLGVSWPGIAPLTATAALGGRPRP